MARPKDIAIAYSLSTLSAIGQRPGFRWMARHATGLTRPSDRVLRWTMQPNLEPTDDWLRVQGLDALQADEEERWRDMKLTTDEQELRAALHSVDPEEDTDPRVPAVAYMLGSVGMVGVSPRGEEFLLPSGNERLAVVMRDGRGPFIGAAGTAAITGADFLALPTDFGGWAYTPPPGLIRV
jgi:hypothetical protein